MWKVAIIEYEAGWGSRVDEIKEFDTFDDAKQFQIDYNRKYNNEPTTPDWYMIAEKPHYDEN